MILGNGDVAATYISVHEAATMVADLQAEMRRYTRCNCHQGKKCAYCLMKDGEL